MWEFFATLAQLFAAVGGLAGLIICIGFILVCYLLYLNNKHVEKLGDIMCNNIREQTEVKDILINNSRMIEKIDNRTTICIARKTK